MPRYQSRNFRSQMAELITFSNLNYAIVLAGIVYLLCSSIAIAQENERFAVFVIGRFVAYEDPGLVLKVGPQRLLLLKVGDIGTLTSHEFAKFGEVDIPIRDAELSEVGAPVSIDGFDDTEPRLVESSRRPKTRCPDCGHECQVLGA